MLQYWPLTIKTMAHTVLETLATHFDLSPAADEVRLSEDPTRGR